MMALERLYIMTLQRESNSLCVVNHEEVFKEDRIKLGVREESQDVPRLSDILSEEEDDNQVRKTSEVNTLRIR